MKQLTNRIESIDILRGVVMVIMALDHVRDYFHYGSFFIDPTALETTTPAIFFTRFITHYCAPVFVFLAGTSAYLYGSKKTKKQLFQFLLSRGVWLIVLEIVVNNLIWTFDLSYSLQIFGVIWAIGVSMICLAFLIYVPKKVLFGLGILLVAGHNLLDGWVMEGQSALSIVWYALHQQASILVDPNHLILLYYPLLPWIGMMSLGYLFGTLYQKGFDPNTRKKWLFRLGSGLLIFFFVVRGMNVYGDLVPWSYQDTTAKTIISFFNVTKYPPSLLYFCITLGPALLFLYAIERVKNKLTDFFLVFGRVPLFYYFLHVLVIHLLAMGTIVLSGGNWQEMVLTAESFQNASLIDYGYSLPIVYIVWVGVVMFMYPFSKMYMRYKANNRDKWWLSYL